jgi:hypothetical protein
MNNPREYLQTLDPNKIHVLYYPGSGTDYSPLKLFGEYSNTKTVIYADYAMNRDQILNMITGLEDWEPGPIVDLHPRDFGQMSWEDFWPDHLRNDAGHHERIANAFGIKTTLTHTNKCPMEFVFLATEAIQSFTSIQEKYHPDVLVLQDHGFADGDVFGKGGELQRNAYDQNCMPELLLVAENTVSWAHYVKVTEYALYPGQEHTHRRASYAFTEGTKKLYEEIRVLRNGRVRMDDIDELG